ncbi:MAG: hypothetical protein LBS74_11560 [Oscillospiraceae bacterium]|jgi:Asp-tRNA(Asn)/Glu-tRNA(Gln) amidotransferase C subunit|nr:hypothetical protein [Oscillospiraceae bacterium]
MKTDTSLAGIALTPQEQSLAAAQIENIMRYLDAICLPLGASARMNNDTVPLAALREDKPQRSVAIEEILFNA